MMIEIPLQIIELEKDNFHILLEGEFQDNTISGWIIDTGASKTVMDINQKAYYEIVDSDNEDDYHSAGINVGLMETMVGKVGMIKFGELEIVDQKVALIDLNHVNEIYGRFTPYHISGLLGGDILMYYKCQIDYGNKKIRFNF